MSAAHVRSCSRPRLPPTVPTVCILASLLLAQPALPPPLAAQSAPPPVDPDAWPAWRGPRSDGVALRDGLPADWPASGAKPVWQAELGTGWSSPVVAGGRVFVTDRLDDRERLLAFDAATGRLLWTVTNPVDFDPHPVGRRHGNGPKATPVVDDQHVYSVGIAGWLQCVAVADGRRLWSVNYPAAFGRRHPLPAGRAWVNGEDNVIVPVGQGEGAPVPLFGYTGSPIVDGPLLVCPVGGQHGGTIIAFDKRSGKPLWHALDENVSYSSPIVATLAGLRQVVVMTGPRVVGLDIRDGRLLWSHPFQIQYDESIGTPTVSGDLVLVSGDGRPLSALRITRRDGQLVKLLAWENRLLPSYLSSMLAVDGHVYGMNDGGEIACLRLSDGTAAWVDGSHGFYSTPVLVGRRLLWLNERATLSVLAADPSRYHVLARQPLADEASWTSPAVVGNRLYVRTASRLRCYAVE